MTSVTFVIERTFDIGGQWRTWSCSRSNFWDVSHIFVFERQFTVGVAGDGLSDGWGTTAVAVVTSFVKMTSVTFDLKRQFGDARRSRTAVWHHLRQWRQLRLCLSVFIVKVNCDRLSDAQGSRLSLSWRHSSQWRQSRLSSSGSSMLESTVTCSSAPGELEPLLWTATRSHSDRCTWRLASTLNTSTSRPCSATTICRVIFNTCHAFLPKLEPRD